jgi:hypothetical protein
LIFSPSILSSKTVVFSLSSFADFVFFAVKGCFDGLHPRGAVALTAIYKNIGETRNSFRLPFSRYDSFMLPRPALGCDQNTLS